MNEEKDLLKRYGRKTPFRVPDGYFENFADRLMEQLDAQYPQYGFAVHKGYGTKRHYAALREYGPCELHRRTFLKKFYGGG